MKYGRKIFFVVLWIIIRETSVSNGFELFSQLSDRRNGAGNTTTGRSNIATSYLSQRVTSTQVTQRPSSSSAKNTTFEISYANSTVLLSSTAGDNETTTNNTTPQLVHDPFVQHCRLYPTDSRIHLHIADLLVEHQAKLIKYTFSVVNYTDNPLLGHDRGFKTYKTNQWSRVEIGYGQTIINLAFNYEILSLMTLSFGVEKLDIELQV